MQSKNMMYHKKNLQKKMFLIRMETWEVKTINMNVRKNKSTIFVAVLKYSCVGL